jgi:hypothetical protein
MTTQATIAQVKPFFRFPLEDKDARSRFLVGTALLFGGFILPFIPGLVASGYALTVLQQTAKGEAPSMPPWHDWTRFLSLGFRGTLVSLIFTGPGLLIILLGTALYFASFVLVPITAAADPKASDAAIGILLLVAMAVLFVSIPVGTVLILVGTIPLPASMTHFALEDRLGAAFEVNQWWRVLRANPLGYFISFVLVGGILWISYLAFFITYSTLVLVCLAYIFLIPLTFYGMLVAASVFGAAYAEGKALLS